MVVDRINTQSYDRGLYEILLPTCLNTFKSFARRIRFMLHLRVSLIFIFSFSYSIIIIISIISIVFVYKWESFASIEFDSISIELHVLIEDIVYPMFFLGGGCLMLIQCFFCVSHNSIKSDLFKRTTTIVDFYSLDNEIVILSTF